MEPSWGWSWACRRFEYATNGAVRSRRLHRRKESRWELFAGIPDTAAPVVAAEAHEQVGAHGREVADGAVGVGLRDGADARDDGGHSGMGEDEFDGGLRHRVGRALEVSPDFLGACDGAGETVAFEIFGAEVVGGELGVGGEFAGEHALVEDDAHDDADAAFLGDVEEFGGGFLFEEIVDDLNAIDPSAAHEIDDAVLILLGGGDADEAEFSLGLERAENFERSGIAIPGARPGVELEEVEFFDAEMGAAGGDVFAQVGFGVALFGAIVGRRRPGAVGWRRFGGDENAFLLSGGGALAQDLGDEFFAAAVAVAGGGVDEVDAEIERAVKRGERVGVGLCAPGAADGPGAEADFREVEGMSAEGPMFHGASP